MITSLIKLQVEESKTIDLAVIALPSLKRESGSRSSPSGQGKPNYNASTTRGTGDQGDPSSSYLNLHSLIYQGYERMVQESSGMQEVAKALDRIKSQLDVLSDQLVDLGLVYDSELVQKVKEAADIVEHAEGLAETRDLLTDKSIDSPPKSAG